MLSLRAKLFLKMIKMSQKRRKGQNKPFDMKTSIEDFRESVSKSSAMFGRVPRDLILKEEVIGGVEGEWILPEEPCDKLILYFHGGGYVSGSYQLHRTHVAKVVKAAKTKAYVFNYSLAPENPFPAGLNDAIRVYRGLLKQEVPNTQIVFAGDSAGGGLAVATLLALKQEGVALPGACAVLSPWLDLACEGKSYSYNAEACLSPNDSWQVFSQHYCCGHNPKNPLISPVYGDLYGLPPMLLFVGSKEVMLDDARTFSKRAKEAGVDVELVVGEELFHCYPICGSLFPEAKGAMRKLGHFLHEKPLFKEV